MFAYWVAFLAVVPGALMRSPLRKPGWLVIGTALSLFVGLRYQVGGDWDTYLTSYFYVASRLSLGQALLRSDPGYVLINWIATHAGLGVWAVNLFSAAAFCSGLVALCRRLPEPLLALVAAIPYLVIVFAMGYTRQAAAFGFVLWALTFLLDRRLLGFVLLMAVAASFHKTAVILMPLAMLADSRRRLWTAVWVGASGLLLYLLFLAEQAAVLWQNYVESGYADASQGGAIRVAMNALPSLLFVLFHRRFGMGAQEEKLWFWIAVFSLACMPLVFQAATAVDRVALYFTPIQLVVFGYLPQLVGTRLRAPARVAVIAFYALVEFVWLNYALHANAWLPYQFWPLA